MMKPKQILFSRAITCGLIDHCGIRLPAKQIQFQFGISLAAKQPVTTWAKFSAPPAAVEKITVYLPGVPPSEDISFVGFK
jgi:hypothetical protein